MKLTYVFVKRWEKLVQFDCVGTTSNKFDGERGYVLIGQTPGIVVY